MTGGSARSASTLLDFRAYTTSFAWLLAQQHRDGSWGPRGTRVTHTAQMIQLLRVSGFRPDDPIFKKALRWLEDNVGPKSEHRWSRLEVALVTNNIHQDDVLSDLSDFLTQLNDDLDTPSGEPEHLDFFWHVLPTLIALAPHEDYLLGKLALGGVRHPDVLSKLLTYTTSFRPDCKTVLHRANHTGLAALYLNVVTRHGRLEATSHRDAFVNWLIESRVPEGKKLHWHYSRGITAYVLMDLILLNGAVPFDTQSLVPPTMRYLQPGPQGYVVGDNLPTYDTSMHRRPLYATILSLRAAATVVSRVEPEALERWRREAENSTTHQPRRVRVSLVKHRIAPLAPWSVPAALFAGGGVMDLNGMSAGSNILYASLGALLGMLGTKMMEKK